MALPCASVAKPVRHRAPSKGSLPVALIRVMRVGAPMMRGLLLLLVFAGCSDLSPTAPEAYGRIPCRPPPILTAMVIGEPFAPKAMGSALLHAAGPMSWAPGTTADVTDMRRAILIVASDIDASNNDGACRLLAIAYAELDALPDSPETLPERDGIRLILALTAQSLAKVMGP